MYLLRTEAGVLGTLFALLAWLPLVSEALKADLLAVAALLFVGGAACLAALLATENTVG